jgi:hypothetical protein
MAASRIVSRNARIIATNATEIAVTSKSRKAWRKRVSVMRRPEQRALADSSGACGSLWAGCMSDRNSSLDRQVISMRAARACRISSSRCLCTDGSGSALQPQLIVRSEDVAAPIEHVVAGQRWLHHRRAEDRIIMTSVEGFADTILTCGGTKPRGCQARIVGRRSTGSHAIIACRMAPTRAPEGSRSPHCSTVHVPPTMLTTTYAAAVIPFFG